MAGVHTALRATKTAGYIAVGGTLTLPTSYGYRANTYNSAGKAFHGCFPEFFHGVYTSSADYGFDAGVLYDGAWRVFWGGLTNTCAGGDWFTSSFTAPSDGKLAISTYFSGGYAITTVKNSAGKKLTGLSVYIAPTVYSSFLKGSRINREMCLAMNPETDGTNKVPASAYYKGATWSNTTLTTTSSSYVAMSGTNSPVLVNYPDDGANTTTYDGKLTPVTTNGFINDTTSATFNKTAISI